MSWLVDTCCISELIKKTPDENVVRWFSNTNELSLYISVITFGEIRKGIEKLTEPKRKQHLNHWVQAELTKRFKNRILAISLDVADSWGTILASAEQNGTPVPAINALIAATAHVHGLTVVTRNTKDMQKSGIQYVNPWEPEISGK